MASAPPLRIWVYSAALAASVLALSRWAPWREPDMAIAHYTQQFLAAPAAPGSLRVVALGSSLLWASTPPGQLSTIPGIGWTRMTKLGTGIGNLRPSLEVIEHFPPDVLIIEENLLAPEPDGIWAEALRQDFVLQIKGWAYRLTGQQWLAPLQQDLALYDQHAAFQCSAMTPATLQREIAARQANIKNWFSKGLIDRELGDRLQRLSRRGVRIVLLELRRSEAVEQVIAAEKNGWQMHLQHALPPSSHIRYLATPAFTQPNLYCDDSHMNAQGARLFSTWWQTQLRQLRDER